MNLQLIKSYYQNLVPAMEETDWKALNSLFTFRQLKKGEFLTKHGEVSRTVSFINKGLLRMCYLIDGKEICTGFVCENNYISSYASFLTQVPSAENIDALEECELVNLSYDDLQQLYKSNPVFEIFGRRIAEYLFIMVSSQTTRLLTLTPEDHYQSIIKYQPFVIQRVPQYMIASCIGISPEHLSRLRKKMSSTPA